VDYKGRRAERKGALGAHRRIKGRERPQSEEELKGRLMNHTSVSDSGTADRKVTKSLGTKKKTEGRKGGPVNE